MMLDQRLEKMISHDEIGIATARIGGSVVRSAFQPIFEVRGNALAPVAVEGFARPFSEGAALPPRVFLSRLDGAERRSAERVCLVLHARNHPHLGNSDLAHVVALDDFVLDADGTPNAALLDEASRTAPRHSIGRIRSATLHGPERLAGIAAEVRRQGMLISLGGFGSGSTAWDDFQSMHPEVAHLDGPWFRRVAGNDSALRLLAQLVRRLRAGGTRVLVRGIETRQELASAIAIGCDLLQGFALARPALVGTAAGFEARALDLEDDIGSKIVSLFRG